VVVKVVAMKVVIWAKRVIEETVEMLVRMVLMV
jgi:hypothetical protein